MVRERRAWVDRRHDVPEPGRSRVSEVQAEQRGAPAVAASGLRKAYGDVVALERLSLEVRPGEFFTMLGPSGSGKTTTLRLIAGFERPDAGTVALDGVDVTAQPPYQRDVNTVFQDYALFPHMTVAENVAYGLMVKGVGRSASAPQRAAEALAMVRLAERRRAQADPALRRPAPARRARARARQPAAGAAARRAARRARPQAAPGDAARAQAHPARAERARSRSSTSPTTRRRR